MAERHRGHDEGRFAPRPEQFEGERTWIAGKSAGDWDDAVEHWSDERGSLDPNEYGAWRHAGVGYGGIREPGPFAGRGPKGWRRDDDEIREDVCQLLCDADDVDAGDIDVEVHDGEVTLQGSVPERAMKHVAEDCTEFVPGVREVRNCLRVAPRGDA